MRLGGGRRTQTEGMCVCARVCTRVHVWLAGAVGDDFVVRDSLAHMVPPAPMFSDPFLYPGSVLVSKTV